jgi:pantoate--beta-alanine ligase
VVVSIFVNPLQFNRRDDFEHYPRPAAQDLERCRERGVTAVYAPTADAMYPAGFDTHIEVGQLAQPLEGAGRPGHFRGVATVVTKLFNAVQPHVAFFGEKDFQQLTVIKRMVIDLDMPINIVGCITTRESDGLALSSRNARLSPTQRDAAIVVPEALAAISAAHERGVTSSRELRDIATHVVRQQPLARLEYIDIVDPHTLHQVDTVDAEVRVVIAVWVGDVRLIDNIALSK